ncbi:MAG TPA: AMP-binding protein, partial [Solirubrobacteraceae bacterium]
MKGLEFPTREQCVLPEVIARQAREQGDKTYLLFADETSWSYARTAEEAWRCGHGLLREGVQVQECVSVWAPAGPDVIRCWFGATAIGAIYAPLNLAARGTYLQHMLTIAGSRVLVAHAGLLERLAGLDLPHLETIVVIGGPPQVELPYRMISVDELADGVPVTRPQPSRAIEPWDDLSLIFTSGTTGPSKGVRASHAQQWFYDKTLLWEDVGPDDRLMQALPMFHNAGMCGTTGMLLRGGSVALVDGFQAKTFLADVRRLGATTTTLVAGMVTFLLSQPEQPDDADNPLRVAYMGPLTRVEEFTRRFGLSVFTSFGMTEAPCPLRSGLNPANEASCGRPIDPADYEVRIVDEHDLPVAP